MITRASVITVCAIACRSLLCQASEANFKVSSLVFTSSLPQVASAITKAFTNGAYHGMPLSAFPYDYLVVGEKRISVPRTNTWNLDRGALPLTLVPRGRKMVAYDEGFEIRAEAVSPNSTKISVTPTESGTTEDWYSFSPHFNRVLGEKYHPPVPSETTNVFLRIARQLAEIRAGRTNALPATPDTMPGFYSHFWKDLSAKDKHDPENWEKMVHAWKEMQAQEQATNNLPAESLR